MTSLMVLLVCSLPPLAIAAIALSGLGTGRLAVLTPLAITAGVLLIPALMQNSPASDEPVSAGMQASEQAAAIRFAPAAAPTILIDRR